MQKVSGKLARGITLWAWLGVVSASSVALAQVLSTSPIEDGLDLPQRISATVCRMKSGAITYAWTQALSESDKSSGYIAPSAMLAPNASEQGTVDSYLVKVADRVPDKDAAGLLLLRMRQLYSVTDKNFAFIERVSEKSRRNRDEFGGQIQMSGSPCNLELLAQIREIPGSGGRVQIQIESREVYKLLDHRQKAALFAYAGLYRVSRERGSDSVRERLTGSYLRKLTARFFSDPENRSAFQASNDAIKLWVASLHSSVQE